MAVKDDIETTKKVLGAVHDISVLVAGAVKEGWKSYHVFKVVQMVSDIAALASEGKQILPELKDLEKDEAQELAGMLYETVTEIIRLAKKD